MLNGGITQLLQICWLRFFDANLPLHHIPKVIHWIRIWWPRRPLHNDLIVMSQMDGTWIILLEVAFRRWSSHGQQQCRVSQHTLGPLWASFKGELVPPFSPIGSLLCVSVSWATVSCSQKRYQLSLRFEIIDLPTPGRCWFFLWIMSSTRPGVAPGGVLCCCCRPASSGLLCSQKERWDFGRD